MYFVSMWLHITCEVNLNIYLLIHFDERMIEIKGRNRVSYMDKVKKGKDIQKQEEKRG